MRGGDELEVRAEEEGGGGSVEVEGGGGDLRSRMGMGRWVWNDIIVVCAFLRGSFMEVGYFHAFVYATSVMRDRKYYRGSEAGAGRERELKSGTSSAQLSPMHAEQIFLIQKTLRRMNFDTFYRQIPSVQTTQSPSRFLRRYRRRRRRRPPPPPAPY